MVAGVVADTIVLLLAMLVDAVVPRRMLTSFAESEAVVAHTCAELISIYVLAALVLLPASVDGGEMAVP